MKKIINGRLYNTETAKPICEYRASYATTDFNYYRETLYQKRTGEFFLAGEGNANSKYAEYSYGSWTGGEGIFPLSIDDAKTWLENCADVETYEKVFGEVAEDDSKKTISLSLTQEAVDLLARMAQSTKKTKSEIVDQLIKDASKKEAE